MSCVHRRWFLEVILSPCSDFQDRIRSVFNVELPEGRKIKGIEYWFSLLHKDVSESFDDIMYCRWWYIQILPNFRLRIIILLLHFTFINLIGWNVFLQSFPFRNTLFPNLSSPPCWLFLKDLLLPSNSRANVFKEIINCLWDLQIIPFCWSCASWRVRIPSHKSCLTQAKVYCSKLTVPVPLLWQIRFGLYVLHRFLRDGVGQEEKWKQYHCLHFP